MITKFENRSVFKTYLILMRPFFDTIYKGGKQVENICELYITNWSYSYKIGIIFSMYQRIRSKETSWVGPRHWYEQGCFWIKNCLPWYIMINIKPYSVRVVLKSALFNSGIMLHLKLVKMAAA